MVSLLGWWLLGFGEVSDVARQGHRVMQARWQCRFFVIHGTRTDTLRRSLATLPGKRAVGMVASSPLLVNVTELVQLSL